MWNWHIGQAADGMGIWAMKLTHGCHYQNRIERRLLMDDLISRQELLKRTTYNPLHVPYISTQDVLDCPSAQKKGHWIDKEICFTCSECAHDSIEGGNFCSNCGSDMRGDEDG